MQASARTGRIWGILRSGLPRAGKGAIPQGWEADREDGATSEEEKLSENLDLGRNKGKNQEAEEIGISPRFGMSPDAT